MGAKKGHVVCVPYPAQGHVTPMMQLANLLHARGFHVTYVNTEFNHKRWMRAKGEDYFKGLPDFRFETIRDGLPPSDKDATQDIEALCHSTQKACLAPFVELVKKLNSSSEVPPVTCIISDGVMSFGVEAGRELGIPQVHFWTSPICGFMAFLQYSELVKRGIFPLKDGNFMTDGTLDTPIDWIPGMKNMRLRDFPSYVRSTDRNDIMFNFMGSEAENCLGSSGIIFNTFDTFEQEVLEALSSRYPNIYTIGPLPLLTRHFPDSKFGSIRTSLWKEDTECLQWVDKWEPESVLYVSYGSITVMTEEHLNEFAWGLANSKHPFLWVVRPDVVMGDSASLPLEFFEEIKDRGMLAHWCPQDKVLNHPSVGAFLTHCGWNSMVESVCGGVPVMCWPFFSEQQTNCRYACVEWGVGVEVSPDVKREELEEQVKEMMGGSGGKKMRERAKEWKKKAVEATEVGGSSYNGFERVIKDLLHRDM